MMTIFTKIIQGEIPCHKIAESKDFLAFLDIAPLAKGHTLIIPKIEIDYIFDLHEDVLGDMMKFAKVVAKKIEKAVDCKRIGLAVIGLEVPHAHIHLVPINNVSDIDFSRPKLAISPNELEQIATTIIQG
ncbi:HIT family protein [Flavobacteriales bacterium]|nr:HIT family protein [Flavobacteriales bacterium]